MGENNQKQTGSHWVTGGVKERESLNDSATSGTGKKEMKLKDIMNC